MPDWKPEIRARLRGLRLTATREEEIVEELSQHLDDRYEHLLSDGSSADEAHRARGRGAAVPPRRGPAAAGARSTARLAVLGAEREAQSVTESNVLQLVSPPRPLAELLGLKVSHVLVSHAHGDHWGNQGNPPCTVKLVAFAVPAGSSICPAGGYLDNICTPFFV